MIHRGSLRVDRNLGRYGSSDLRILDLIVKSLSRFRLMEFPFDVLTGASKEDLIWYCKLLNAGAVVKLSSCIGIALIVCLQENLYQQLIYFIFWLIFWIQTDNRILFLCDFNLSSYGVFSIYLYIWITKIKHQSIKI